MEKEQVKEMRGALKITISAVIIVAIIFLVTSTTAIIVDISSNTNLSYYSMYGLAIAALLLLLYAGRIMSKLNKKIREDEKDEVDNFLK